VPQQVVSVVLEVGKCDAFAACTRLGISSLACHMVLVHVHTLAPLAQLGAHPISLKGTAQCDMLRCQLHIHGTDQPLLRYCLAVGFVSLLFSLSVLLSVCCFGDLTRMMMAVTGRVITVQIGSCTKGAHVFQTVLKWESDTQTPTHPAPNHS
jgi:hypothetical protein